MRAIDILVMLQSFLNRGQKIEKVTVYPSDYGLERMADESRFGPMGLISGPASSAPQRDAAEPSVNGRKSAKQSSAGRAGTYKMDDEERAAILEALNEQDSDSEPASGSDSEGEPAWCFHKQGLHCPTRRTEVLRILETRRLSVLWSLEGMTYDSFQAL